MTLSRDERIAIGLEEPLPEAAPPATEFVGGTLMPRDNYTPNPRLVLKEGEKATGHRIRLLVNELLAGNLDQANRALQQLFAANPKEALKLYIELAEFSLPKLKAVAVQVEDKTENPRSWSFAQLQQELAS